MNSLYFANMKKYINENIKTVFCNIVIKHVMLHN